MPEEGQLLSRPQKSCARVLHSCKFTSAASCSGGEVKLCSLYGGAHVQTSSVPVDRGSISADGNEITPECHVRPSESRSSVLQYVGDLQLQHGLSAKQTKNSAAGKKFSFQFVQESQ